LLIRSLLTSYPTFSASIPKKDIFENTKDIIESFHEVYIKTNIPILAKKVEKQLVYYFTNIFEKKSNDITVKKVTV